MGKTPAICFSCLLASSGTSLTFTPDETQERFLFFKCVLHRISVVVASIHAWLCQLHLTVERMFFKIVLNKDKSVLLWSFLVFSPGRSLDCVLYRDPNYLIVDWEL